MAEEIIEGVDTQILAIGRDALKWLDKIKVLHRETMHTAVYVEMFEYNAGAALTENLSSLRSETQALKGIIEDMLSKWEPGKGNMTNIKIACLNHIEKIRKSAIFIRDIINKLMPSLTDMEAGIVKELEGDKFVGQLLAGFEALEWKLDKSMEHGAHSALRTLISRTRYTERKERHLHRDSNRAMENIKGMIKIMQKEIIPKMDKDFLNMLEQGIEDITPYVDDCISHGFLNAIVHLFGMYVTMGEKIGNKEFARSLEKVAGKYKDLLEAMDNIKAEIDDMEAREGALLQQLEAAIKRFEEKGWLKKAA